MKWGRLEERNENSLLGIARLNQEGAALTSKGLSLISVGL